MPKITYDLLAGSIEKAKAKNDNAIEIVLSNKVVILPISLAKKWLLDLI